MIYMNPIVLLKMFKQGISTNLSRIKLYYRSFTIELFSNLLFVSVTLIFWNVIYANFGENLSWSKTDMYLFLGFVELFVALKKGLIPLTGKLWYLIFTGRIDNYLTKPVPPQYFFVVSNIHFEFMLPSIPMIFVLFYLGGGFAQPLMLVGGILFVLLAIIITGMLELTFSSLSFFFGKINAIDEIVDSFREFNRIPLTFLTPFLQLCFSIAFPFMFNATIPTILTSSHMKFNYHYLWQGIVVFIIWVILLNLVWKVGRKRYEGYGG